MNTPEFDHNKDPKNVKKAVERYALSIRSHWILITVSGKLMETSTGEASDRRCEGVIRYDQVGEGAYSEKKLTVSELLKEIR